MTEIKPTEGIKKSEGNMLPERVRLMQLRYLESETPKEIERFIDSLDLTH